MGVQYWLCLYSERFNHWGARTKANQLAGFLLFTLHLSLWLLFFVAMLQADDEDDMMEMQMKSPFGSSFRTFNATDYKPIGEGSYI